MTNKTIFKCISLKIFALYGDLLPRKLHRDILKYHTDKDYKPSTHMLPPRTGQVPDIDSLIINKQQAEWISSKIVESTKQLQGNQRGSLKTNGVYKFTLLYRCSRDGNTFARFRELCNNKGPTIAVGKVLNTEEILGGYNPFAWGSQNDYAATKESFIFALDKDENIVSFVGNDSSYAIRDCNSYFPTFGNGYDLLFGVGCSSPYASKSTYQVPIRDSSISNNFEWVDWEMFLISKL